MMAENTTVGNFVVFWLAICDIAYFVTYRVGQKAGPILKVSAFRQQTESGPRDVIELGKIYTRRK